MKVVTTARPLPEPIPGVRRVSVNSFGYGGANAHIILEGASSIVPNYVRNYSSRDLGNHSNPHDGQQLLVFSANEKISLKRNIEELSKVAWNYSRLDLAHTLAAGRGRFRERAYVLSSNNSWSIEKAIISTAPQAPGICMVFTGQGAQWPGMGAELMQFNAFSRRIKELEKILESIGEKLPIAGMSLCSLVSYRC